MHDIDRAMFEVAQEGLDEVTAFGAYEAHSEGEALETQLAAELLELSDEEELDQFLGNLVKRAASAASGFVRSPTGRALTGMLKNTVRQALPQAGQVIGNALGSGGGQIGAQAGRWLAKQFESEGLSGEDSELAGARSLVRVATQATQRAIAAGPGGLPAATARKALIAAANRNLPALTPLIGAAGAGTATRPTSSGRWVRQGSRIILFDA